MALARADHLFGTERVRRLRGKSASGSAVEGRPRVADPEVEVVGFSFASVAALAGAFVETIRQHAGRRRAG